MPHNRILNNIRTQQELARRLATPVQFRMTDAIQKHVERANEMTRQWQVTSIAMNQHVLSISQTMEETTSRLRSILIPHIDVSQISRQWDNIRHGMLETEEDIKVFKAAMVGMGYPPHDGMSIRQMRTIAKRYSKDSTEVEDSIDEIMTWVYDPEKMKDILLVWEKSMIINKRLPLLRNAIMAHNLGMYDLVVPSVLSQLEGLLVDIFGIKGIVTGEIQKTILKNLLLKDRDYEKSFSFDSEIHKYYSENILVSFEHGKTTKSDLSRHAILHGSHTDFGKQKTSLKVLLVFDYLVSASKSVNEDDIRKTKDEVSKIRKRVRKRK